MHNTLTYRSQLAIPAIISLALVGNVAGQELDITISRIRADQSRLLLGDGSGIRVGIVDSGIDSSHPALNGRMIAQANFVPTEPGNTGNDVFGHGTAVAAIIAGAEPGRFGMAPAAQYINARVLNSGNSFSSQNWVINGVGFAIANRSDVLNLSLSYSNSPQNATSKLSLMCDYISGQLNIPVIVSAGNNGNNSTFSSPNQRPQGPGEAYNVISTASANRSSGYNRITSSSSWGGTSDGRNKPDLAAPGDQVQTANSNWETGPDYTSWSGTSFAAPHITGLVAQQLQFGRANNLSTDTRVLKATLMNSAEKIANRNNLPWAPRSSSVNNAVQISTSPLDNTSGAGMVDGVALYHQYVNGDFNPGTVPHIGWSLAEITSNNSLSFDLPPVPAASFITATLVWNRKVSWNDSNINSIIDESDSFTGSSLDELNLELFLGDTPVARSISTVDNVEHIRFLTHQPFGLYSLRVNRINTSSSDPGETFAIAWSSIPEPSSLTSLALLPLLSLRNRRSTTHSLHE